jgi:hypothetical protein
MDESILRDLAVLLVTVNRAVENNRSSAMVPQRARRRLCEALGVQRLDETPDEIEAKLRAALGLAEGARMTTLADVVPEDHGHPDGYALGSGHELRVHLVHRHGVPGAEDMSVGELGPFHRAQHNDGP